MADYLRTGRDEAVVVARVIGVVVRDGDDLDGLVGDRPDLRQQAIVVGLPWQRVDEDHAGRGHANNRVRTAARDDVQPWLDRLDCCTGWPPPVPEPELVALAKPAWKGTAGRQRRQRACAIIPSRLPPTREASASACVAAIESRRRTSDWA